MFTEVCFLKQQVNLKLNQHLVIYVREKEKNKQIGLQSKDNFCRLPQAVRHN